jgi:starch synthase
MSNASMVRPDQDPGSAVGSIDDGQRRNGGRDTDRVLDVVVPREHASERPKVAVLRGAYLSQFEMQTYEKMLPRFDLQAFQLTINRFPTDLIDVPIRRVASIDEPVTRVSPRLGYYFNLFLQATCGLDYLHLGLVKKLAEFDIVHTMETFNAFSWQGLKAQREHGCKLVTTVWENRPFAAERFKAKRDMKYAVLKNADLHIAITERARQCMLAEGAHPDKVKVIPAGIDVQRFHPAGGDGGVRERLGIGANEFVILSVAALRWEKGVHDLVHAVKRLSIDPDCRGQKIRLVLAGSGPEAKKLRALADRIGLKEHVTITRFDYDEIPAAYRAADVFALASTARPGWLEQFAYVLPEALASGLPVVAAESGSIPEVVGDAGVVVPPSDFLGLSNAFKALMLDPDRREQLGVFGRDLAETRYDSRVVAGRIADEYTRLLED